MTHLYIIDVNSAEVKTEADNIDYCLRDDLLTTGQFGLYSVCYVLR